jgi:hypothetical protein
MGGAIEHLGSSSQGPITMIHSPCMDRVEPGTGETGRKGLLEGSQATEGVPTPQDDQEQPPLDRLWICPVHRCSQVVPTPFSAAQANVVHFDLFWGEPKHRVYATGYVEMDHREATK